MILFENCYAGHAVNLNHNYHAQPRCYAETSIGYSSESQNSCRLQSGSDRGRQCFYGRHAEGGAKRKTAHWRMCEPTSFCSPTTMCPFRKIGWSRCWKYSFKAKPMLCWGESC